MKKTFLLLILLSFTIPTFSQNFLTESFYNQYEKYLESSIKVKRVKHQQVEELIEKLKSNNLYSVKTLGHSLEGRSINMITLGNGETDVLLWSQMHGDESTATMALFDIFNFFSANDDFNTFRKELLENLTIHIIPMLNPDGSEIFTRRNALFIDLNRDAERLQCPETQILKAVRDSLDPKFGFNLHDQSTRYTAGRSNKSAALSFLAPAYNYEKTINDVRSNTMKVIVNLYDELSKFIPGHIGRYSDDFEPRAFGDNMVKWGTSSVLIESGGWKDDTEKQYIRKLNFVAILTSLQSISEKLYEPVNIADYEQIPENERLLFNSLFKNVTINYNGKPYIIDVGVNVNERSVKGSTDYYFTSSVAEVGDLSVFYGYDEFDCTGMVIEPGKVYQEEFDDMEEIFETDLDKIISEGNTFILLDEDEIEEPYFNLPINVVLDKPEFQNQFRLYGAANFVIKQNDKIRYVVVNGFVYDIQKKSNKIKNGLFY